LTRCRSNDTFEGNERPCARKPGDRKSDADDGSTNDQVSGEVDERSITRLDLALEAKPMPRAYAPPDLDFRRDEGWGEEWIGDVGSDVREDSVKTELQAHEQNEDQVQAEDRLRSDEETDSDGSAEARRSEVFAFEITEGAFAFLAPERKRRQGLSWSGVRRVFAHRAHAA
jgi:hypothetical protein